VLTSTTPRVTFILLRIATSVNCEPHFRPGFDLIFDPCRMTIRWSHTTLVLTSNCCWSTATYKSRSASRENVIQSLSVTSNEYDIQTRFRVIMVVNMKIVIFWHKTPCSLVDTATWTSLSQDYQIRGVTSQEIVIFVRRISAYYWRCMVAVLQKFGRVAVVLFGNASNKYKIFYEKVERSLNSSNTG